jgi:hypothetical protein
MYKIFTKYPKKDKFEKKVSIKAKKFVHYPQKEIVASMILFLIICPTMYICMYVYVCMYNVYMYVKKCVCIVFREEI